MTNLIFFLILELWVVSKNCINVVVFDTTHGTASECYLSDHLYRTEHMNKTTTYLSESFRRELGKKKTRCKDREFPKEQIYKIKSQSISMTYFNIWSLYTTSQLIERLTCTRTRLKYFEYKLGLLYVIITLRNEILLNFLNITNALKERRNVQIFLF